MLLSMFVMVGVATHSQAANNHGTYLVKDTDAKVTINIAEYSYVFVNDAIAPFVYRPKSYTFESVYVDVFANCPKSVIPMANSPPLYNIDRAS